jgi:type II secretory pathway pseudopilin PulG
VEVVVAFAVLALVLPLLLRTMSGALGAADRARDGAVAVMLAESALARLGIDRPLRPGTEAGTFGNGFRWHLVVVPDATGPGGAPDAPLVAYDVTLTVSSASGGELTLRTLKLGPREVP